MFLWYTSSTDCKAFILFEGRLVHETSTGDGYEERGSHASAMLKTRCKMFQELTGKMGRVMNTSEFLHGKGKSRADYDQALAKAGGKGKGHGKTLDEFRNKHNDPRFTKLLLAKHSDSAVAVKLANNAAFKAGKGKASSSGLFLPSLP